MFDINDIDYLPLSDRVTLVKAIAYAISFNNSNFVKY